MMAGMNAVKCLLVVVVVCVMALVGGPDDWVDACGQQCG